MQEVRQRGRPLALLHEFVADQQMSADLRDLEREIEIGRKLRPRPSRRLPRRLAALAALLLLRRGALTGFAAMAMLLRGRDVCRGRQRARERDVGDGFVRAQPVERRRLGAGRRRRPRPRRRRRRARSWSSISCRLSACRAPRLPRRVALQAGAPYGAATWPVQSQLFEYLE